MPSPYTTQTCMSAFTYSTILKTVSICMKIRNKWTDGPLSSRDVLVRYILILSRKQQSTL